MVVRLRLQKVDGDGMAQVIGEKSCYVWKRTEGVNKASYEVEPQPKVLNADIRRMYGISVVVLTDVVFAAVIFRACGLCGRMEDKLKGILPQSELW